MLSRVVVNILRPLIRVLLRKGVPYGTFAELAKWVYVDIARKDFSLPGRKISNSRIGVITGINRHEISHIKVNPVPDKGQSVQKHNKAARIMGGWRRDPDYCNSETKELLSLPFDGNIPSFTSLVKKYAGDYPVRAILDELIRVKAVKKRADETIELLTDLYIPENDEPQKLIIMGEDVNRLVSTIDHNLQHNTTEDYLQLTSSISFQSIEAIEKVRELSKDKGRVFLREFDKWLCSYESLNPSTEKSKKMKSKLKKKEVEKSCKKEIGIGLFYFEEDITEENNEEES